MERTQRREGTFRGTEFPVRDFGGARAVRVSHAGGHAIDEHRHDWPTLTIHVAGACTERLESGDVRIAGPAAILLPAGHFHADAVEPMGLETFGIVFDPAWLRIGGSRLPLDRARSWMGGPVAGASRRLHALWSSGQAGEAELADATKQFLQTAQGSPEVAAPRWFDAARAEIETNPDVSAASLAKRLDLHPAWLARAYRYAAGEGLHETIRRHRVERASELLRITDASLVDISLTAGFCDQSHMNRCFHAVIRRTPGEVRRSARLRQTAS